MNVCCRNCLPAVCFFLAHLFAVTGNSQEIKRPPIKGIAFVQLQVSDIKKSTVFYQSLLGLQVTPVAASANSKNHFFNVGINQRQQIQLQDGLPPGQDERLLCIAFQTTDAEAMRAYLQSKRVTVPATVSKEAGMVSFTVTDPDNHSIKFVEYTYNTKEDPKRMAQGDAVSQRLLHAGLTIKDMQAANAFYGDILGFSEIWRGGANDSITSWINMRVPEGTDYLEYMLVSGPVNRQQLGGMHHLALMVPDMQQAVDLLGTRSQTTSYPVAAPRIGRNNRWQLNLFDPDGTRIELMEPFTMR